MRLRVFSKRLETPLSEMLGKKYMNRILPFQLYIGKLGAKRCILRTEGEYVSENY